MFYLYNFKIYIHNILAYNGVKAEITKENDQLLNSLGDSYQRLATIYIKKARGYAVRNEDTEVKIRDTLFILKKHSDDGAICSIAIPNESGIE